MSSERSGSRLRALLVAVFALAALGVAILLVADAIGSGAGSGADAPPAPAEAEAGGEGREPGPMSAAEDTPRGSDAPLGATERSADDATAEDVATSSPEGRNADRGAAGEPPASGQGIRSRPESPARDELDAADAPEPEAGTEEAPGAAQAAVSASEVDGILARAESRYAGLESLRARFEQEIHNPLLDRHRTGTGIWYQKGRSRFKMDFEEPPEDVIVADGVHLWLYYPSTNPRQVIRQTLDANTTSAGTADVLARILEEARTAYEASYGGRETVAGVSTHRIDLEPTTRSPYQRVRVWIAADDHLVRRFEIVEQSETVRTVTLRDLEPDAPIADHTFRFEPPADADVFAG